MTTITKLGRRKYRRTHLDDEVMMYTPEDIFSKREEHILARITLIMMMVLPVAILVVEHYGLMDKAIEAVATFWVYYQ